MNQEALNNPNYNPQIDPDALSLYKLMDKPDQELYDQYRQVYDGFPTKNPYSGVLHNPNTCDIDDVKTAIQKLSSELQSVEPLVGNSPTWYSQIIDPSNPNSAISQLSGGNQVTNPDGSVTWVQPNSAYHSVDQAQHHTDKFLANLPSILGLVTAGLGLATVLNGLLNPCSGLDDFIGSILGNLKPLFKAIKSAINKISDIVSTIKNWILDGIKDLADIINQGIQMINDAVSWVMNLAKQITDFIAKEIDKFINALIDSLRLGLSSFLSSLGLDPCLKGVFSSFMTDAAKNVF